MKLLFNSPNPCSTTETAPIRVPFLFLWWSIKIDSPLLFGFAKDKVRISHSEIDKLACQA